MDDCVGVSLNLWTQTCVLLGSIAETVSGGATEGFVARRVGCNGEQGREKEIEYNLRRCRIRVEYNKCWSAAGCWEECQEEEKKEGEDSDGVGESGLCTETNRKCSEYSQRRKIKK